MALDKHPRRFTLKVTEIEVALLEAQWREETDSDVVDIEIQGKLLPTTYIRIHEAIKVGWFNINQRTLA